MNLQLIKADLLRRLVQRKRELDVRVIGNSMSPAISDNSIVRITRVDHINDVAVGEIYLFINPKNGRLVCHRLISINNDQLFMKGDNEEYYHIVKFNLLVAKCLNTLSDDDRDIYRSDKKCIREWLFDRFNNGKYWLWHTWKGKKVIVNTKNELIEYIGDYNHHECSKIIDDVDPNLDCLEMFNYNDWTFVASYDATKLTTKFRCIHDLKWKGAIKSNINAILKYRYNYINFRKRQAQYLGFYNA